MEVIATKKHMKEDEASLIVIQSHLTAIDKSILQHEVVTAKLTSSIKENSEKINNISKTANKAWENSNQLKGEIRRAQKNNK